MSREPLPKTMYNRRFKKKKTKRSRKKIQTPRPSGPHECARCEANKYLEIHHVFPGPNRNNSSIHKCVEWLCFHCHRDNNIGAHGGNEELNKELKSKHQLRLLNEGMTLEEFINIFGQDYIGVD